MQRIILPYGGCAGVIIIGSMILGFVLGADEGALEAFEWVGYLIMIVALSLIFVGIKRYRDRELGGVIRFGTAAKVGLGITLVASAIYVVAWEANLAVTDYAFIDDYTASVVEARQADGVTGTALEAVVAEMEDMKRRYANPLYRVPITFLEIFPVGLLITLVSAGLLRNSAILPART